jgi:hypothetical protein
MGIRSQEKLGPSSSFVRVLIDLYVDIGDSIALQYGGSEAHKKVTAGVSETIAGPIGKVSLYFEVHLTFVVLTPLTNFIAQRAAYLDTAILQQRFY